MWQAFMTKFRVMMSAHFLSNMFVLLCQLFIVTEFLIVIFNLNCFIIADSNGGPPSTIVMTILGIVGNNTCIVNPSIIKMEYLNVYCLQLFVIPIICWISLFPTISIRIVWLNFISTIVVFVISICVIGIPQCLLSGMIWILLTFFVIRDYQMRNMMIFLSSKALKDSRTTRNKDIDEANVNEMRAMIANVAHDLKTVSLTTCQLCI